MKRDLLTIATAWANAWHKYHDAKLVETEHTIEIVADTDDWRDLKEKETALLNAVSTRTIH